MVNNHKVYISAAYHLANRVQKIISIANMIQQMLDKLTKTNNINWSYPTKEYNSKYMDEADTVFIITENNKEEKMILSFGVYNEACKALEAGKNVFLVNIPLNSIGTEISNIHVVSDDMISINHEKSTKSYGYVAHRSIIKSLNLAFENSVLNTDRLKIMYRYKECHHKVPKVNHTISSLRWRLMASKLKR